MKFVNRLLIYVGAACLVLAPVGLRMLSWRTVTTPVDPAMARQGQVLFDHEWTANDPLCRGGDGLGPVYNANSCVACHHQGGPGGSGSNEHNVTMFSKVAGPHGLMQEGVIHSQALAFHETLQDVHPSLPNESRPTLEFVLSFGQKKVGNPGFHMELSQRNTPALFGVKLIDEIPDRVIANLARRQELRWGRSAKNDLPVGRVSRLPDGRVGKFGWKAQSASLSDFVQAACANELGLGNPGQAQPRPLGKPNYQPPGLDLTLEQCDQLTAFVSSLPRPVQRVRADIRPGQVDFGAEFQRRIEVKVQEGEKLFLAIGCADCHVPSIGSVDGLYSDLLLHHMGESLMSFTGSYNGPSNIVVAGAGPSTGTPADEWRTPPLWGVGSSAPYLHDGRAATLEDAIKMHGGQALDSSRQFSKLGGPQRAQVIEFLKSLQAP